MASFAIGSGKKEGKMLNFRSSTIPSGGAELKIPSGLKLTITLVAEGAEERGKLNEVYQPLFPVVFHRLTDENFRSFRAFDFDERITYYTDVPTSKMQFR